MICEDLSRKNDPEKHVIFLVHGFGASKVDMLQLKSFIEIKYNVRVIISV